MRSPENHRFPAKSPFCSGEVNDFADIVVDPCVKMNAIVAPHQVAYGVFKPRLIMTLIPDIRYPVGKVSPPIKSLHVIVLCN